MQQTFMNKFDTINKVFTKLNIDYPSNRVLSTLNVLNVKPLSFLGMIVDAMGSIRESEVFFTLNLRKLNKKTPNGFFVDLSKYFDSGSFVTVRFGKVIILESTFTEDKLVEVESTEIESRIILDGVAVTYRTISDLFGSDLGDISEIRELENDIRKIVELELEKNLGVPIYLELE